MLGSLSLRILGGFAFVIILTLGVTGIVFFSLLGGYRDALDRNTLQLVADQVLFGVDQFAQRNVSAPEFARYLEAQSEETGALVFLLDADGRVVRDLSPAAAFNDLQLPVTLRDVRRSPEQWLAGEAEANGESLPFLARLVPVTRFRGAAFVAIAVPGAGASGVVGDLLPRLLISGLIGFGVALLVGLLIGCSIYNPLHRLTDALRAAGGGQYDVRVPEERPDETRELARALNRMTAQVQANERTLQDFMADVNHELRTPLTAIRGFTQALIDGTVQDEQQRRRSVQVIDDEARRMLRLVEDLLDLSRMQAGEFRLRRENVDPAELLTHVADVFEQRAADAGLDLRVEVANPLPVISCDFDRMVQVLTNLVDNAMEHTREGGVTLGASREGGEVALTVRDTGEGIPPDELGPLFERFYRARSTARRRGTGLGLAISREIVQAQGGEIGAESEVGVGTIFRITLPIGGGRENRGFTGRAPRAAPEARSRDERAEAQPP